MLRVGNEEVEAVRRVMESGDIFRYNVDGECGRFERRICEFTGATYAAQCASGTNALTAALIGLEIGPGDEVLVPAHTFMASAMAVLAAGAIPVVVDIDESIMIDPQAVEDAIGPCTRAVMPVHMWGHLCDMDAIMEIAARRNLLVIEDASQCVCGFYKGKGAGAIGHAGAWSFNFYKNMTCGEGGTVLTSDERVYQRARCAIDPTSFYWEGRDAAFVPFSNNGARASEFEGAILNAQLDRIPALLEVMRGHKSFLVDAIADSGLTLAPRHDPAGECPTAVFVNLPTAEAARAFQADAGGAILADTGRHNYTEWDPILAGQGAHHPALNPFNLPENETCRKEYSKDMLPKSLDILARTVSIGISADHERDDLQALADRINAAAEQVLSASA